MYRKTGALNEYADLQVILSSYHLEDGSGDRALKILFKLEKFAVENGSQYYEAKALIEQSLVFETLGDTLKSSESLKKGYSIANAIGAKDLLLIK